ncbi:Thioredoxin [Popillia japonica]|uniref:Thioredoxin n=1 Tax=Popillia japonica TaxID=7064 RepID=A0AAW1JX45_POPJA
MSTLETETGQIQTLHTVEGHQPVSDKDAESDKPSKQKKPQREVVIVGHTKPIYLRLIITRMINICKELGLVLLIAIAYAALTNDPPKVSKTPTAYPFFPKGSVVKDYYRGELTDAIQQARLSDTAFVMFYAPWDSESLEVRKEFELAARYMHKLITFSAVNCWQPNGECRSHYNKVYNWPVMIAYPAHGRGIQYNGPKTALHMIRFLNAFIEPVVRVNNLDVVYLRQTHDAVVVANINALPGSLDYAVFYSTALRYLEKDPFQEVVFAVNTDHSNGAQKLSLYIWNNTMIYIEGTWRVDSLLNWVHKNIVQVTVWASPTGSKSQQLANYIQPGPALILFTPRNPLFDSVDYYDMLHEVALLYYYCKNNTRNFGAYLLSLGIHYHRLDNYKKMKTMCTASNIQTDNKEMKAELPSTVTYFNTNKWSNNSYCISPMNKKDTCINNEISHIIETKLGQEGHVRYKEKFDEMYKNMLRRDSDEKRRKDTGVETDYILESYKNVYKTSMLTGLNDGRSPRNLQKVRRQNKCRLKTIAEKYSPAFFAESLLNKDNVKVDITGLACQVNRSLSMIAMDSLKYHHFANSLSIDILNRKHKTALVIVDEKMESHYVLGEAVTDASIREFIQDFSRNKLKRALLNSSQKYNYTHTYIPNISGKNHIRITELDSVTYLPTVMKRNTAVVVLYHSKQCSFCSGIAYTFLTVAKAFSPVKKLQFARIDGELNSLPWEYTMESYPTILFFPDIKKSESRIFPKDTEFSVTNLVHFILTNLNPSLKLHAMWSLCNQTKFQDETKSCISKVRIETLSLIETTLKEWRMSDMRDKAVILDKLRELKHLHLLLAHQPADGKSIEKCLTRLQWRMSHSLREHRKKIRKSSRLL